MRGPETPPPGAYPGSDAQRGISANSSEFDYVKTNMDIVRKQNTLVLIVF